MYSKLRRRNFLELYGRIPKISEMVCIGDGVIILLPFYIWREYQTTYNLRRLSNERK